MKVNLITTWPYEAFHLAVAEALKHATEHGFPVLVCPSAIADPRPILVWEEFEGEVYRSTMDKECHNFEEVFAALYPVWHKGEEWSTGQAVVKLNASPEDAEFNENSFDSALVELVDNAHSMGFPMQICVESDHLIGTRIFLMKGPRSEIGPQGKQVNSLLEAIEALKPYWDAAEAHFAKSSDPLGDWHGHNE